MPQRCPDLPVIYREYTFPGTFPVLLMQGTERSERVDFIHFHNCIEIAFCKKGFMYWNLENEIREISSGSFLLLPPFFTHASYFPLQNVPEVCCDYLFFNPEEILRPFYPKGLPEEFGWCRYMDYPKIFSGESFPEETELLYRIIEEMQEEKECSKEIAAGLIEALLIQLYRNLDGKSDGVFHGNLRAQLFPAIAYMDKNYIQDPDTSFLALLCGLSRTQFLKYFRNSFHQTPRQYLRVARIRRACLALTSTENSILSIALEAGFQSLPSFNRVFREIMGRSPQAFRNEKRGILKNAPQHVPYYTE